MYSMFPPTYMSCDYWCGTFAFLSINLRHSPGFHVAHIPKENLVNYLRSSFVSLPPINSRNSDQESHIRLFSPPPHYARRFQPFLPSSTRVELRLPTLGALSSWSFFFIFFLLKHVQNLTTAGFELTDQHNILLVCWRVTTTKTKGADGYTASARKVNKYEYYTYIFQFK